LPQTDNFCCLLSCKKTTSDYIDDLLMLKSRYMSITSEN
jgi:hypothetical protein